MSITDELRKYVTNGCMHYCSDYLAIADRIDAEHESACAEAYGNGVESVPIALDESAWVELPKDADGVPIHVGDVMESKGSDFLFDEASFEVRSMRCDECGWEVYDRLGDRYAPSLLCHHHAPTVEDVLREFVQAMNENMSLYVGEAIDADEWRSADNKTVAEFAARLELREVDE